MSANHSLTHTVELSSELEELFLRLRGGTDGFEGQAGCLDKDLERDFL